jgi:hypothetical protein
MKRKSERRKREKQARLPKIPRCHNGSKPIKGKFPAIFKKAVEA